MRCRKAEELLLARFDGASGASPADPRLLAHLAECATCRAQEEALTRSLGALQALPGPAPDLWPQFQARLGAEVDCQTAREQLPAYAEGALGGASILSMRAHLANCDPCTTEELALDRSLRALEQVAPNGAPDLWADFSAKLAASQPAPKSTGFRLPAWLLPGTAWRPGLALAGVALAAMVLRGPLPMLVGGARVVADSEVEAGSKQTSLSAPAPAASEQKKAPMVLASAGGPDIPSRMRETPKAKRALAGGTRRAVRGSRVRRARLRKPPVPAVRQREVEAPARPAPVVRDREELMAVAPPLPMPEATLDANEQPADTNSAAAQARIMPEAVQVGLMLARMESSVRKPFQEVGYEADER